MSHKSGPGARSRSSMPGAMGSAPWEAPRRLLALFLLLAPQAALAANSCHSHPAFPLAAGGGSEALPQQPPPLEPAAPPTPPVPDENDVRGQHLHSGGPPPPEQDGPDVRLQHLSGGADGGDGGTTPAAVSAVETVAGLLF